MKVREGNLEFDFFHVQQLVKFDDTAFYRKSFNCFDNSKGIDFILIHEKNLIFMEVKDCTGREKDNVWRIFPDNRKRDLARPRVKAEGKDSLDIEVAEKVAMTLACLCGAYSQIADKKAECLKPYFAFLASGQKKLKVILFLEGDFATTSHPQSKVLKDLTDSIRAKLNWLNCDVLVENSTINKKYLYHVNRCNYPG